MDPEAVIYRRELVTWGTVNSKCDRTFNALTHSELHWLIRSNTRHGCLSPRVTKGWMESGSRFQTAIDGHPVNYQDSMNSVVIWPSPSPLKDGMDNPDVRLHFFHSESCRSKSGEKTISWAWLLSRRLLRLKSINDSRKFLVFLDIAINYCVVSTILATLKWFKFVLRCNDLSNEVIMSSSSKVRSLNLII